MKYTTGMDKTDTTCSRPIAFHPTSVIFETSSHAELLEKTGARALIKGIIDELLAIAKAQGCQLPTGFAEKTMEQMIAPATANSVMYQDFLSRRPMEVETYLGSPVKVAQELGVSSPRLETLYALLHNVNTLNQSRPQQSVPAPAPPPHHTGARMSSLPAMSKGAPYMNGNGGPPPQARGSRPSSRAPSLAGGPPPPGRRGPPPMNGGYPGPRMNGHGHPNRGPHQQMSRRGSFEGNDLEEFSHLVLYNNLADDYDGVNASSGDLALREREIALRQKELALRERELNIRQSRGGRPSMPRGGGGYDDDDEDGEDFFDPMTVPHVSAADADNLDMMSVTSRRTRKMPSSGQLRGNPEMMGGPGYKSRNPARRPPVKNRTSATIINEIPNLREELMNNPLVGYSSDRYANVDRMNMGQESRTNSLTAERLSELQHNGTPGNFGPGGYPANRRGSHSPGNPLGMNGRPPSQRPSPPNGYPPGPNGRPSPPGGLRQPMPRHMSGPANIGPAHQIEQHNGVSNLYPPKSGPPPQVRSLTGSASASAGSGDSNRSARLDSEPSAHSSSSSLGPRPPIPVR
jgi:hypothetical protein